MKSNGIVILYDNIITVLFNIIQPFKKKLKYTFFFNFHWKIQLIIGQNKRHCCLLFLKAFAKQCLSLCKICPCSIDFSASYVQVFPVHSYRACLKNLAQKQKKCCVVFKATGPTKNCLFCFAHQFPHLSRRRIWSSLVLGWSNWFLHIGHHHKGEDAHQH